MSAAAEPEKLSDHPAFVFTEYAAAFIPLGFLYAFDFISDTWKPIWATRRIGIVQATISAPCLAGVLYFFARNIMDKDYKEAAAALVVAVVNLCNLWRTLWGLFQLYEFRNWNVQALSTLLNLGYRVPQYEIRRKGPSNNALLQCLWRFYYWLIRERSKGEKTTLKMSIYDIKKTVDFHMKVNSTLVDKEFRNHPFGLRFALPPFWTSEVSDRCEKLITAKRHGHISRLVSRLFKAKKSKEMMARWFVSFLARFGYEWLHDTRHLCCSSANDKGDLKSIKQRDALNLAVLSSFHTTHGDVSMISPNSRFCLNPRDCRSSIIRSRDFSSLPLARQATFGKDDEIDVSSLRATIRDAAVDDWDKAALNELVGNEDHRGAVLAITPEHIACFAKLMNHQYQPRKEQNLISSHINERWWNRSEPNGDNLCDIIGNELPRINWDREDPRIDSWIYQLGFDSLINYSDVFSKLPFRKELLWTDTLNPLHLQASIHTDNLLAFESGKRMDMFAKHHQLASQNPPIPDFKYQKDLEMRRLQNELQQPTNEFLNTRETARFLGCVFEAVRSRLAAWTLNKPLGDGGWKVDCGFSNFRSEPHCSEQLFDMLPAVKNALENADPVLLDRFSVRLLWETQKGLWEGTNSDHADLRNSPYLVLCFVLGFPALRISFDSSPQPAAPQSGSERIALRPGFIIEPVEAPQDIKIFVRPDEKTIEEQDEVRTEYVLSITCSLPSSLFDWQRWKDSVLGRLSAGTEWRQTRLFSKMEQLWEQRPNGDTPAKITEGFKAVIGEDNKLAYDFVYWKGWPPHLPNIARFEVEKLHNYWKDKGTINYEFQDLNAHNFQETIRCVTAGLNATQSEERRVESFEDGEKLLQEGKESSELRVFGRCIALQGDQRSLQSAISHILNKDRIIEVQERELRSNMFARFLHLISPQRTTTGDANDPTRSVSQDEIDAAPISQPSASEREAESVESSINPSEISTSSNTRNCAETELRTLAHYFSLLYEKHSKAEALKQKVQVLFHVEGPDKPVSQEAIEAAESFLLLHPDERFAEHLNFYLALAYQSKFVDQGTEADRNLAVKKLHFLASHSDYVRYEFALEVGFLLEKGHFDEDDADRRDTILNFLKFFEDSHLLANRFDNLFYLREPGSTEGNRVGLGPQSAYARHIYKVIENYIFVDQELKQRARDHLSSLGSVSGPEEILLLRELWSNWSSRHREAAKDLESASSA